MRNLIMTVLVSAVLIAAGCTNSKVVAPHTHAPINPASVKVYQDPPARYEKLGRIETTAELQWRNGGDITPAVEALKRQAAALGANGVLFRVDWAPDETQLRAGGSYMGQDYEFPVQTKPSRKALATAIYVVKE